MTWVQVLTPNTGVKCWPGECLRFVSDAFKITASDPNTKKQVSLIPHTNYGTATAAWNASQQHNDQSFPAGCYVPIWFSLAYEPAGHVAIMCPDGSVYSSSHPTSTTPTHHASLAALIAYYAKANPLTYLGWSEDIGGTAVITVDGDTTMISDADNEYARWAKLGYQIRGRSLSRQEFQLAAVGKTWLQALEILSDNQESDDATHAQELGQLAIKDNWQGQIYGLRAQLKTEQDKGAGLAKNLDDSQLALDDANKQLAQAESLASDDDTKIKALTVQLAAATSKLTALAEKPPAPSTSTSTSIPPFTAPQPQPTQTTWLDSLLRYLRLK